MNVQSCFVVFYVAVQHKWLDESHPQILGPGTHGNNELYTLLHQHWSMKCHVLSLVPLWVSWPLSPLHCVCICAQLPENSIGKALRLLHERLSSKICGLTTNGGVHVETSEVEANGIESNGVVADAVLSNGIECNGLSHIGVESSGILINSSI